MSSTLAVQVLHQNDDFWVLTKPAGMSFHAESADEGFIESLYKAFPEQVFYPVHRLDKLTSGLVLVALNKSAAQEFGRLFEMHAMEKYYLALSSKKPKKKQGCIKGGMQFSRRGQWKLTQTRDNFAVTRFFSASVGDGRRLYFLQPQTGKTHQLRVALKSIGAPILGDQRYGGDEADRGYLHAYRLSFDWQGERVTFCHFPTQGVFFSEAVKTQTEAFFQTNNSRIWPK